MRGMLNNLKSQEDLLPAIDKRQIGGAIHTSAVRHVMTLRVGEERVIGGPSYKLANDRMRSESQLPKRQ